MVQHPSRRLIFAVCALALGGCADDERDLPMSPVSGTVSLDGPLTGGQVIFQHETGEQAAAAIGTDGRYATEVPQGKNQVIVRALESSKTEQQEGGPRAMEIYTSRVPEHYSNFNTSGLEIDVKEGPNTFDIKLEAARK